MSSDPLSWEVKCKIVAVSDPLTACTLSTVSREWREAVRHSGGHCVAQTQLNQRASLASLNVLLRLSNRRQAWLHAGSVPPGLVQTLLDRAARHGYFHIIEFLLCSTDPSSSDFLGAAVSACKAGQADLVDTIVSHERINLNTVMFRELMYIASHTGHLAVINTLLSRLVAEPSPSILNTSFIVACEENHLEVARRLLQMPSVDPAHRSQHAIRTASLRGHDTIVSLLLQDPRVDPSHDHCDALRGACERGHTAVVTALLSDKRIDIATIQEPPANSTITVLLQEHAQRQTKEREEEKRTAAASSDSVLASAGQSARHGVALQVFFNVDRNNY